jgi:lipoprotein-anchoring transpeptidase ErfK/SrfK
VRRVALVVCLLGLAAAGALVAAPLTTPGAARAGATTAPTTTIPAPRATSPRKTTPTPTGTTRLAPPPAPAPAPPPPPPPAPPKAKAKPLAQPKPEPVRVPASVKVGGIHVGGLAPAAAVSVVRAAFHAPVVLRVGIHRFVVPPKQLGAVAYVQGAVSRAIHSRPGADVRLTVVVHAPVLRAYLASLAKRFDRAPVNSVLTLRSLAPHLTKGSAGQRLDEQGAAVKIAAALVANRRAPLTLKLLPRPQKVSRSTFGPVIVIRRESKALYLYNGTKLVHTFGVAVGQSAYPTPLGRFDIVVKWRDPWWYPPSSDWAKGLKPVPPGPGNPLGTRWMGLSSPGVGIHGTPDDASIGYSLSHGCIRMHISDAEWLFDHVNIGTTVFILPA